MSAWFREHDTIIYWLFAASGVAFVVSLIAVPLIVVRLPADYFAHERRAHGPWSQSHPLVRLLLLVVKNALGIVFVLVGLVMLLTPGQGLLTMVIGLVLLDFPGKFRLERWVLSRRIILRPINWLRRRAGRPPLVRWRA